MDRDGHTEAYKNWSIVVTVGAWGQGSTASQRFVPTVAVLLPGKLQQRFVDVGSGAAFLDRGDALRHGIAVAKSYIDAAVKRR